MECHRLSSAAIKSLDAKIGHRRQVQFFDRSTGQCAAFYCLQFRIHIEVDRQVLTLQAIKGKCAQFCKVGWQMNGNQIANITAAAQKAVATLQTNYLVTVIRKVGLGLNMCIANHQQLLTILLINALCIFLKRDAGQFCAIKSTVFNLADFLRYYQITRFTGGAEQKDRGFAILIILVNNIVIDEVSGRAFLHFNGLEGVTACKVIDKRLHARSIPSLCGINNIQSGRKRDLFQL